jgi:hypothetical protein
VTGTRTWDPLILGWMSQPLDHVSAQLWPMNRFSCSLWEVPCLYVWWLLLLLGMPWQWRVLHSIKNCK